MINANVKVVNEAESAVSAQPSPALWQAMPGHGASVSFFEFWPGWPMYAPVLVLWLLLALRYRSLTLPLLANPGLPLAGMVGVSKHELMQQAQGACRRAILPWLCYRVTTRPIPQQAEHCLKQAQAIGIQLPLVGKPDVGCRGAGVKLIHSVQQLAEVLACYPPGADLLCQTLASWEPEAGIFYVRDPETGVGEITSLTFKFAPFVTGDGLHTLQQLVARDSRAGQLVHLYQPRHQAQWQRVLSKGEKYRLVFSASHCRGAIFCDARQHITPALTAAVQGLLSELPEFYYGRLDVKFRDLAALQAGETLQIIEINGASAEAIHIWDKDAKWLDAVKTLLWQYRTLFRLGAYQRRCGLKPPGILALLRHWRHERRLTRLYPATD